ncbi:hypothetical protein BJ742DRAFT_481208 [Cladochytrium replicatum]|nr:hypothetical protein BJ742DRAFT_481208 [Cladochytrium replicatum]
MTTHSTRSTSLAAAAALRELYGQPTRSGKRAVAEGGPSLLEEVTTALERRLATPALAQGEVPVVAFEERRGKSNSKLETSVRQDQGPNFAHSTIILGRATGFSSFGEGDRAEVSSAPQRPLKSRQRQTSQPQIGLDSGGKSGIETSRMLDLSDRSYELRNVHQAPPSASSTPKLTLTPTTPPRSAKNLFAVEDALRRLKDQELSEQSKSTPYRGKFDHRKTEGKSPKQNNSSSILSASSKSTLVNPSGSLERMFYPISPANFGTRSDGFQCRSLDRLMRGTETREDSSFDRKRSADQDYNGVDRRRWPSETEEEFRWYRNRSAERMYNSSLERNMRFQQSADQVSSNFGTRSDGFEYRGRSRDRSETRDDVNLNRERSADPEFHSLDRRRQPRDKVRWDRNRSDEQAFGYSIERNVKHQQATNRVIANFGTRSDKFDYRSLDRQRQPSETRDEVRWDEKRSVERDNMFFERLGRRPLGDYSRRPFQENKRTDGVHFSSGEIPVAEPERRRDPEKFVTSLNFGLRPISPRPRYRVPPTPGYLQRAERAHPNDPSSREPERGRSGTQINIPPRSTSRSITPHPNYRMPRTPPQTPMSINAMYESSSIAPTTPALSFVSLPYTQPSFSSTPSMPNIGRQVPIIRCPEDLSQAYVMMPVPVSRQHQQQPHFAPTPVMSFQALEMQTPRFAQYAVPMEPTPQAVQYQRAPTPVMSFQALEMQTPRFAQYAVPMEPAPQAVQYQRAPYLVVPNQTQTYIQMGLQPPMPPIRTYPLPPMSVTPRPMAGPSVLVRQPFVQGVTRPLPGPYNSPLPINNPIARPLPPSRIGGKR